MSWLNHWDLHQILLIWIRFFIIHHIHSMVWYCRINFWQNYQLLSLKALSEKRNERIKFRAIMSGDFFLLRTYSKFVHCVDFLQNVCVNFRMPIDAYTKDPNVLLMREFINLIFEEISLLRFGGLFFPVSVMQSSEPSS